LLNERHELAHRLDAGTSCLAEFDLVEGRPRDARQLGKALKLSHRKRRHRIPDSDSARDVVGVHALTVPHAVMDGQPLPEALHLYDVGVPLLRKTIADNVRAILGIEPGESGVARLMARGFSNGSASRILAGATSLGVDLVDELGRKLGVEAWLLCVPHMSVQRAPDPEGEHVMALYRQIHNRAFRSAVRAIMEQYAHRPDDAGVRPTQPAALPSALPPPSSGKQPAARPSRRSTKRSP
jgi:hypothetical protein